MPENSGKIKLFISYSHDDVAYFKIFTDGLKKVVKNSQYFDWIIWDDTKIHVGTFWDDEIQKNIKDCNVAMLLVSIEFMASNYIKEKEFNEFSKRYADKGILIVPVVFKPCDFNNWDDLARLQFFKPNGSIYGKSEIEHFTFADLIKFKETDGTILPNPNTDRYILDLVKKIEDSFKDFLKIQETHYVNNSRKLETANINNLSDYPRPSALFTGRKREIEDFKKNYESFRLFAVEGLGGTGKTDFVSKCIDLIISDKTKIIWLNGSAQSNFDVFIETAGYGDVLKGEKKTDLTLYSGLKDLIERDQRIIFWDNYNDYEDPSFSRFLSFANQYLRKSTIILITKTDPSIVGITSLPIIRLEGLNKDALVYAKKLKASNIRYSSIIDSDLEKICIGVEGHPLAIEFSMWLMGYGKTADEIIQHIPEFAGIKKVEEFSKRLFLDIFNHANTTDDERDYFLKCSVFKERIDGNELKYLYDGKDVFHLLVGLIDKLLITAKEGFYEIHPLVRSFSYEKLLDKKPVHKKAAEYFITQRKLIVSPSLEEKIFYHLSEAEEYGIIADSIQDFGRKLIKQGQLNLLNEFMNKLVNSGFSRPIFEIFYGDIAQIKAEWDNAISHYAKASEYVLDKDLKAESIIKHGEILYRRGDVRESLPYFVDAVKFAKSNGLAKEESRAINDIGLVFHSSDDFDQASSKYMEALKIRKSINDLEGIAATYNNLGNLFSEKQKYEKALEFYNAGLKINEEAFNKTEISLNLINIGIHLRRQGNFEEALEKFNESLKLQESIGDKELISRCLNSIGVIYMEQNQPARALLNYEESIKLNLEVGDRVGLATTFCNLGAYYLKNKIYDKSLDYFFKSLDLFKQIGSKSNQQNIFGWISQISNQIGKVKFKELATQVHQKLELETRRNLIIEDFFHEPHKNKGPKTGRNDPCYCGSGKKYKHCHGRISGN